MIPAMHKTLDFGQIPDQHALLVQVFDLGSDLLLANEASSSNVREFSVTNIEKLH
jgi:hypothetical protein